MHLKISSKQNKFSCTAFDVEALFLSNEIPQLLCLFLVFAQKIAFLCVTESWGENFYWIIRPLIPVWFPNTQRLAITTCWFPWKIWAAVQDCGLATWSPPQMVTKVRMRCETDCTEGIIVFQVCSWKNMHEVGDTETWGIYIIKLSMIWNSWCCSRLLSQSAEDETQCWVPSAIYQRLLQKVCRYGLALHVCV